MVEPLFDCFCQSVFENRSNLLQGGASIFHFVFTLFTILSFLFLYGYLEQKIFNDFKMCCVKMIFYKNLIKKTRLVN